MSEQGRRRVELIQVRKDAGFTQESFADKLQVSRSTVANRWEKGVGGLPHPKVRRRMADLLGLTIAELEELFATEDDPTGGGAKPDRFDPSRSLLRPTLAGSLAGRTIGSARLESLEVDLAGVVERYEQTGPAQMSPPTLEIRKEVMKWLDQSPRVSEQARLHRLAAQAGGLLGYMAVNVGRFRLADAFLGEALHLASEAGDLDLEMWLRGTQAHCAYYEGNWDLAIAFARAGRDLSPRSPQAIRLLVNGEARSQAKLGRSGEAEQAVGEAMDLLDRRQVDPGLTPCISFEGYGYARLAANAATAHVAAGDVDRVLSLTKRLDDDVAGLDSVWSRALIGLDVAITLLLADPPEVEEAMRLGCHAIHAVRERPIRSVWQRAHELRQRSEQWLPHSAVVEYHEAFSAWARSEATLDIAGGVG